MLTVSQLDESQGSGRGHVHVIDSHTGQRLQQIELIEPIKEVPVDFTSLNHSYVKRYSVPYIIVPRLAA